MQSTVQFERKKKHFGRVLKAKMSLKNSYLNKNRDDISINLNQLYTNR